MFNQLKITICDSDKSFSKNICNFMLKMNNAFNVCSVSSAQELLNEVKKGDTDIVLTEYMLPEMDGLCITRKIRSMPFNKQPIVCLMSSFSSQQLAAEAVESGVSHFIIKPATVEAICERLTECAKSIRSVTPMYSSLYRHDLEVSVINALCELGIPAHIKGFEYLRRSLIMAINDSSVLEGITKILYPTIAKDCNSKASRVERDIRRAIELAWDRGSLDIFQKWFGYTISAAKGKPTNSEFVAMVSEKIRLEQACVSSIF